MYAIMPGLVQRTVWPFTRVFFPLFIRLKVEGIENILSLKGNFIIAANHSSELDPIIIATCMPFFSRKLPMFFVGREKDFYSTLGWKKYLYGGTFFDLIGVFPAYKGLNDYARALRHHLEVIRDNRPVCIFPSGKRNLRGERPEAKPGVAFLAHATQLPVIPVLIQGAEDTNLRAFFGRKRMVRVVFGKPLYAKDLFSSDQTTPEKSDFERVAKAIMDEIQRQEFGDCASK